VAGWLLHLLPDDFSVSSAGLLGWGEQPATAHSISVAERSGVSLTGHRSRRLDPAMVNRADLVLAMTRQHAWGVAARDGTAAARTFLLPEAVRRGRATGPRGSQSLRTWSESLGTGRDHRHPGRPDDELADPAGQPIEAYETLAGRVEPLVLALAELLAG